MSFTAESSASGQNAPLLSERIRLEGPALGLQASRTLEQPVFGLSSAWASLSEAPDVRPRRPVSSHGAIHLFSLCSLFTLGPILLQGPRGCHAPDSEQRGGGGLADFPGED